MPQTNDIVTVHTFGLTERQVVEKLGGLVDSRGDPSLTTSTSSGIVTIRIGWGQRNAKDKQQRLANAAAEVKQRLGPVVFGCGSQTIQGSLVALLAGQGATLATAESCTGGLVGTMITEVPGASQVYLGGWVVYTNRMKAQQLGVPMQLIEQHGAVSESVARALARGAVEHSGASLSVALTGVAGPAGGTPDKPVGTVWIGIGHKRTDPSCSLTTEAWLCNLSGNRAQIRQLAAQYAMQFLRFAVLGASVDQVACARHAANKCD